MCVAKAVPSITEGVLFQASTPLPFGFTKPIAVDADWRARLVVRRRKLKRSHESKQ